MILEGATEREIGWLIGILEGEGCFSVHWRKRASSLLERPQVVITVAMTDEDVIQRVHRLVGAGRIYLRNDPRPRHKPCHLWRLMERGDVEQLLLTVRPEMGERRQARIDEMLTLLAHPVIRRLRLVA